MFTCKLVCGIRPALVLSVITRNKGTGKGPATDPVQQLFLDKLREYRKKSPDGSFVDPDQSILKELKSEMGRLDKGYGGGTGVDMTAFPSFTFQEPKLDPIDEAIPETKDKKKPGKPSKPSKPVQTKAVKKPSPDWITSKKKKK